MASRTDQLHSHQFARQRVIGALALRDPDPASSPLRRIGGALFAGVMLAALALAAVGAYGVIRPGGNNSWRDGGSVIVERETGARFVYRDGVLHPVLNYSSALLVLGSAQPRTRLVARGSLAGVPRGAPLGIPGAPDLLPAARDLIGTPWSLCSRSVPSPSAPSSSAARAESVLSIGATPGSITPLGRAAVLARDPDGHLYLIWNEHRFAIRDQAIVLGALGWSGRSPVAVAPALLNVVSAGPDLGRIPIAQRGRPAPLSGARVGQVFVVESQAGTKQYAVAVGDGLAAITQVQADLLLADPTTQDAGPTPLSQAAYSAAVRAASLIPTGDASPPATTPELTGPGPQGGVCASIPDGGAAARIGVTPSAARSPGEVPTTSGGAGAPGVVTADWIAVAPGRGTVVESLAGAGAPSGALAFVSDLGVRHPVPSPDVLTMLGYSGVRPQRMPAAVVALLPAGRALDPVAARQSGAP